jgi:hypothetical protein
MVAWTESFRLIHQPVLAETVSAPAATSKAIPHSKGPCPNWLITLLFLTARLQVNQEVTPRTFLPVLLFFKGFLLMQHFKRKSAT